MPLTSGTKLGPFEIRDAIGAGAWAKSIGPPICGWAALFRALYRTENYDKKCDMMRSSNLDVHGSGCYSGIRPHSCREIRPAT